MFSVPSRGTALVTTCRRRVHGDRRVTFATAGSAPTVILVAFEVSSQAVENVPLAFGGLESGHVQTDGVLGTARFVHDGLDVASRRCTGNGSKRRKLT